ncbi:flagellar hook assembly protein FlgD [Roseibacterium sp. SDUM158016]|uniref:flagellar hook assembly protein FlgD n=1 Tax=Roseicyclus sediminis TaxID=2980997 RepID=UPI0021D2417E|nr:flagellar hook assembly protein FlgD [Roseibacterium sp. SDUM158016]MCU4654342.1 flagellar hook assembly protein FlgD [Roseibacterium sp. SDUM158016]
MIDPTASNPTTGQPASVSSLSRLNADYQSFLKLLTAQVANQDPLAPMDSSTFVTQLAQLSQVEQSIQVNANLADISARIAGAVAMSDVQLIGRTVTVPGDQIVTPTENTRLSYQLMQPADTVSARVVMDDGTILRSFEGLPGTSGQSHELNWDGRDDAGLPVIGEGPFRLEIIATDAEGESVPYNSYTEARVESVIFGSGVPTLVLDNGSEVSSSLVARVE